jgi:hypothetical protein
VLEEGPHHRVLQQIQLVDLPGGGQQEVPTTVTELATGLNVPDPDNPGQWRPAVPAWEIFDDGLVARQTQTRVILSRNLNVENAFDALTPAPASLRLVGHPVSLGIFDPVTGQQVLLAEVQDSAATLAASNVIVFPNCLRGIRASIRYTIRRAGLSQDLLLEERFALPGGFSERSRLELYTEFDAATPPPVATVRVLRRETDPMVRALMAEPDLTDTTLQFGDVYIGPGRAYALNRPAEFGRPRVVKSWIEVNRLPVLVDYE